MTSPATQRKINELERRLAELERSRLAIPPSQSQENGVQIYEVMHGNLLYSSTIYGAKRILFDYAGGTIAEVLDLYAPGAFPDGVCVVRNLRNGVRSLCLNANPSPVRFDLWERMVFAGLCFVSVPITGETDRAQRFVIPGLAA